MVIVGESVVEAVAVLVSMIVKVKGEVVLAKGLV